MSAQQIAEQAVAAVVAGADAVHVHPKDGDGHDTLDPDAVGRVVSALRQVLPSTPVSVTTGAWAEPLTVGRVTSIRDWEVLPDSATVNWHEAGSRDVASILTTRGVAVEVGLWTADAARDWRASDWVHRCSGVLVELPDGLSDSQTRAYAMHVLSTLPDGCPPVLLHGEGSSCWPALRIAARLGLDCRIGLEDVLVAPDGATVADNAALVDAAVAIVGGAIAERAAADEGRFRRSDRS